MKLTESKLRQIVREEVQRLSEDEIGWDNLPDGWDEDSLDSFAKNLTGQEGEEGFFSACMDEVEDKFDDPEAFCASLKDEYLDTTDWRGESTNKPKNMKLTETKLRSIIREQASQMLSEQDSLRVKFRKITSTDDGGRVALYFKDVDESGIPDERATQEHAEKLENKIDPYLFSRTVGSEPTNIGITVYVEGGHMGGLVAGDLKPINRTFEL